MNENKSSRFWPGVLVGLGIAQLYNYAVMTRYFPKLMRVAEDLGSELSPLARFFGKPIVYVGIPVLLLAIIAFLAFFLRRQPRWLLLSLVAFNVLSWIVLALMSLSLFQPLWDVIGKIG
jgi:uncharacterized membrane protein